MHVLFAERLSPFRHRAVATAAHGLLNHERRSRRTARHRRLDSAHPSRYCLCHRRRDSATQYMSEFLCAAPAAAAGVGGATAQRHHVIAPPRHALIAERGFPRRHGADATVGDGLLRFARARRRTASRYRSDSGKPKLPCASAPWHCAQLLANKRCPIFSACGSLATSVIGIAGVFREQGAVLRVGFGDVASATVPSTSSSDTPLNAPSPGNAIR